MEVSSGDRPRRVGPVRLKRRDALLALAAGAAGGIGGAAVGFEESDEQAPPDDPSGKAVTTLVATAEVVYPSAVEGIPAFVQTYVEGLPAERRAAVAATTGELDVHARRERGRAFDALAPADRESLLRDLGVDRVAPDADGTLPERVRFYVVNQLLYGLYTTPKGSRLMGIENPVGYPGGYQSYQKPPSE